VAAALPRLYLVTDRRLAGAAGRSLEEMVAAALGGLPVGAALVQLREKDLAGGELAALGARVLAVCRARGARLLVNDRLDVALAIGADGVHLPEAGLPVEAARRVAPAGFLVGRSVHGAVGAAAAATAGADLVLCGPVWPTPSKAGLGEPLGESALADAARAVAAARPATCLFAIGGVDQPGRAQAARAAGAHGVAAIRAWLTAADPAAAAAALPRAVGGVG
jgi:thiamine-phosphate pyrophosphorylase